MKTSIRSLMILVLQYKVKSCDGQKNICTTYNGKLSKGPILAPVVFTDLQIFEFQSTLTGFRWLEKKVIAKRLLFQKSYNNAKRIITKN